jgi:hypothetical protein
VTRALDAHGRETN